MSSFGSEHGCPTGQKQQKTLRANQPSVGLRSDTHLDKKAPPRQTTGLDLIRNGWTYNCMECHTLIAAKWRYDRPVNEHLDIKLDHGNNRFCLPERARRRAAGRPR